MEISEDKLFNIVNFSFTQGRNYSNTKLSDFTYKDEFDSINLILKYIREVK